MMSVLFEEKLHENAKKDECIQTLIGKILGLTACQLAVSHSEQLYGCVEHGLKEKNLFLTFDRMQRLRVWRVPQQKQDALFFCGLGREKVESFEAVFTKISLPVRYRIETDSANEIATKIKKTYTREIETLTGQTILNRTLTGNLQDCMFVSSVSIEDMEIRTLVFNTSKFLMPDFVSSTRFLPLVWQIWQ